MMFSMLKSSLLHCRADDWLLILLQGEISMLEQEHSELETAIEKLNENIQKLMDEKQTILDETQKRTKCVASLRFLELVLPTLMF